MPSLGFGYTFADQTMYRTCCALEIEVKEMKMKRRSHLAFELRIIQLSVWRYVYNARNLNKFPAGHRARRSTASEGMRWTRKL